MEWDHLTDSDTAWFLPAECKKDFTWKKREEIPEEIIRLLNGGKVKLKVDMSQWRGCSGSIR